MFRFRDRGMADKIVRRLERMNLDITLMHVCGTQQDTIVRFGLDTIFRKVGVEMRQGPGCPICITPPEEFQQAIRLAEKGKTVCVYGDAYRVPAIDGSLADAKTRGLKVRVVYSIEDALRIAKKDKNDTVFFAIGFETTAPSTAITLLSEPPKNFYVLNSHRYVPPVLFALLDLGELRLDGLIEPGHVSTVIGCKPYEPISEKYHIPQVISGFEPLDMLISVYMIARQLERGEAKVENEYTRSVRYEGNVKALKAMEEVFEPQDASWRGFAKVPRSGMKLKKSFEKYDARLMFEDELKDIPKDVPLPKGCRCDEVLRGLIYPKDCPLFGRACTPEHPVGACMVSVEGSCNIEYKYSAKKPFY